VRLAEVQEQKKTEDLGLPVGSRAWFFFRVTPCSRQETTNNADDTFL